MVEGPDLPKRKRGRPSKADIAARAAAEAEWLANAAKSQADTTTPPVGAPAPVAGPAQVLKPTAYTPEMPADVTPKDYFLILMRDPKVSPERRDRAAQVAISFTEAKPGAEKTGKKEKRQQAADELTQGSGSKFGGAGRPPLAVVGKGT